LLLVAATTIACLNPAHRDGQSIRCGDTAPVMRLEGISAPPIGAACAGGVACDDDPGVIARDHLAELTRGRGVVCTMTGKSRSRVARCRMDGIDLSCAMVADGMAKATAALGCPPLRPGAGLGEAARRVTLISGLRLWVPAWLVLINLVTFGAFALDRYRAMRAMNRVAPTHLLGLTFFGGGIGGLLALWRFDHLRDETPFINQFAVLVGFQIGAVIGLVAL
jgi:uncharacterized membrane protein YsdA (DUF1294 family)